MNDGWQDRFAEGFRSSGSPVDLSILFWFLLLLALVGAGWYLYERFRRATPRAAARKTATRTRFVAVPGRINPLQQIRIHEMIDEFRQQEPSAQTVPSAVLEKYSEFFFHQLDRLKTQDKEVEEFINQHYSLKTGDPVELDFHTEGSLHLIKTQVIGVGTKGVLVDYQSPVPDFLHPGAVLHVNYSSGRHFLQGHTQILEVRPEVGIVLKKPTQVILTSERRYSRLPIDRAPGTLQDTRSDHQASVKVLDLSLEGVRIQVGRPLEKTHVYVLHFEGKAQGRGWPFGPIECVPSKAFLTASGNYESGLVFLGLPLSTRQRLITFMKALAQDLQGEKKAEDN